MKNTSFPSSSFEFKGVLIPPFELQKGKIVKIYVPNFDNEDKPLGHKFCLDLLNEFKTQNSEFVWSKEYSENRFIRIIKPISVKKYITKNLKVDFLRTKEIANSLGIDINEKVKNLTLGKGKALTIKCNFLKHDALLFDYYGIGTREIDYIEKIVDNEIRKGKSAIIFDRLEFQREKELFDNIDVIKITVSNKKYRQ